MASRSASVGAVNGLIWTFVPTVAPGPETLGATSGLVSQATYLGVLLGPPAIFATLVPGGWAVRVGLVVLAVVVQIAPLPFRLTAERRSDARAVRRGTESGRR